MLTVQDRQDVDLPRVAVWCLCKTLGPEFARPRSTIPRGGPSDRIYDLHIDLFHEGYRKVKVRTLFDPAVEYKLDIPEPIFEQATGVVLCANLAHLGICRGFEVSSQK